MPPFTDWVSKIVQSKVKFGKPPTRMEEPCLRDSTAPNAPLLLHTLTLSRLTVPNRVFAAVYSCAVVALFYLHAQTLLHSKTIASFTLTLALFIADIILALLWASAQSFRMRPVYRKEYPENIDKLLEVPSDLPGLDVFICTADPYREPPTRVVNTALSVMAYEYPTEKISVYVSDDGGSALTLFAFMEAAKFAAHWLPFCRKNDVAKRSPDEYFASNYSTTSESDKIKMMYERMKARVEKVVETGRVDDEYITSDEELGQAVSKWSNQEFTPQNHPTVIQVLLQKNKNRDITGHCLPNLVYVSRQKSHTSPHHFKAGALNVLVRVSAAMTNAPVILTLDCDMYSNDPTTPFRAMCYVLDPRIRDRLAYVQFPQEFHGLNQNDIYACELKRLFKLNPFGLDGLSGPNYLGTGCFIRRRALFGDPSTLVSPEIREISPDFIVNNPNITSPSVLEFAHQVAGCNYENQTNWGSKIGFRYGSLVEDFYTGFRLQSEGWRSVFCNPDRAAFLGNAPIDFLGVLIQNKRWQIGLLEVVSSRYSPITFGTVKAMGLFMGLAYSFYASCSIMSIPITIYSFLPQLALINGVNIFAEVSGPWFLLYMFLFLGAYGQDMLEYLVVGRGTIQRWWSDQRMWMMRGVSCFLFAITEFLLKYMGIPTQGFDVTSKVVDGEQGKRYEQGLFEFGAPSAMFVTLTMAAIINVWSFTYGLVRFVINGRDKDLEWGVIMQWVLSGLIVMNCVPIYEAMVLRRDRGKMDVRSSITATILALAVYAAAASLIL